MEARVTNMQAHAGLSLTTIKNPSEGRQGAGAIYRGSSSALGRPLTSGGIPRQ
jgi:hypothetical protein